MLWKSSVPLIQDYKMLSRNRRSKIRKVAKNPNMERINAYQLVKGFTRVPVSPDGNCFYTTTGFHCGLNAEEMRELVMSYFVFKKAEYSIFFESERDFMRAVKKNSLDGVWNSELCDIAPHATAQILRRSIIIHNYDGEISKEILIPVENVAPLYPPLHIIRSNNHYEILLNNNKKPNKNIYPLPDVSMFYGIIDLTFEDDSDSDSDSMVDIDDSDPEPIDNNCLIKF
jgi:hypothetical protein